MSTTATAPTTNLLQPQLDAIKAASGSILATRLNAEELTALQAQFIDYNNPYPVPAVGSIAPQFSIKDSQGRTFDLHEAVKHHHIILAWYRGQWCPFCTATLKTLNGSVDEYHQLGAQLYAVTPTLPSITAKTVVDLGLKFPILSDVGSKVAKQYGTLYQLNEDLSKLQIKLGVDWAMNYGDESHQLPHAGFFVVEKGTGKIAFAYVNQDFRIRPEPTQIADVIRQLNAKAGSQ